MKMMSDERPYVRVSVEDGESTRRTLLENGLFDKGLKIVSRNGHLYLPLVQGVEISRLDHVLSACDYDVGLMPFEHMSTGPRTLEEALESYLSPEEIQLLPRAYDLIGDIAVLELPDELVRHKNIIGSVFQTLHPNFNTVLTKVGAISGTIRTREYELIAGEDRTYTIHTEYGCRIAVDLAKAYFSPRLLEEHHRVASEVAEGETVVDMFTGVGPFALHIARLVAAEVYAVDINPDAIDLLRKSMKLNRLRGSIHPVVGDAGIYVQEQFHANVDRVIMNHPSGASSFVQAACIALKPGGVMHYYDFIGGTSPEDDIEKKVTTLVAHSNREVASVLRTRRVRDSAPYEYQMVIDITLH